MPTVATSAPVPENIWEQIKLGSIAGIPDERLSREYGVTRAAIRKRRSRQSWPSPSRVEMEQEKARQALKDGRSTLLHSNQAIGEGKESGSHPVTSPSSALELIGKTKEELGELNRMVLLSKLSPVLQKAVTDSPGNFTPQDIKELVSLGTFLHKMADLDKPETQVNLSLWSSQSVQPERDVTPQTAGEVEDDLLK